MKNPRLHLKDKKTRTVALILLMLAILGMGFLVSKYGVNRLSSSDCTKYEQYDALRGECYFECDTDEECEATAKKVEAELDAFFAGSQSKIDTKKPESPAPASQDESKPVDTEVKQFTTQDTGSETSGKVYTVTTNQTLSPEPTADDQKLWELFLKVASKPIVAERLETFEVFNDGNNDSAASVWESNTSGKWHMNVNAAFATDKKDMIHTMVHEFGHILTLNSSQVYKTSGACPLITVPEGCIRTGTVLGDFYTKYWQEYGPEAGGESDDPVAEFSEDTFVTEYAATNMIEDLAETFAFFVLRPAPSGSNVKDQKIKFLYDNSEMVSTRNRIRANLASEL